MPDTPRIEYIYVTTTGRKSGKAHQIEIWFVEYGGRYYMVSEGRDNADWVKNILATPAVVLRVGAREALATAAHGRAVDAAAEPELAAAVSALMDAKYGWSDGLIVELTPTA